MMRRRDFIKVIAASAGAWPLDARAQQSAMPVIGFLRSTTQDGSEHLVAALKKGLVEAGFRDGENVAIEFRFADGQHDRLPALAGELVNRPVAAIVANTVSAQAAKAATATLPIIFVTGSDPVRHGLVASLNRPGGNVTGVIFTTGDLSAKRLGLLHELVPKSAAIAALLDPNAPASREALSGLEEASRAIGRRITTINVTSEREFEAAFATIVQAGAGALFVGGGPLFLNRRRQLVDLAARHSLPASYATRQYVEAGGLMSYGTNQTDAYRQAGLYVGRVLKGYKPADLPVIQTTRFELLINLKTAKTLGIDIPPTLLARANDVIE